MSKPIPVNAEHVTWHRGKPYVATFVDPRGRTQYVYPESRIVAQNGKKFDKMRDFEAAIPKLRAAVDRDLARAPPTDKRRVVAAVVKLIDTAYFRVGSERYAEANGTYGISTLRAEHVDVDGDVVRFRFVGKSEKEWDRTVADPRVAAMVRALKERAGDGPVFPVSAADVNAEIKRHAGASAKMFRTFHANRLLVDALQDVDPAATVKGREKQVSVAVKAVAEQLGHTPGACRSAYLHPRLIEEWTATGRFAASEVRATKGAKMRDLGLTDSTRR